MASVAASASGSSSVVDERAPDPAHPTGWVEAARMEQWAEAARLIDALDEPRSAAARYVRARAALVLGDHERAARWLADLESELPLLAKEIAEHRAVAQLEVGPFLAAADHFKKIQTLDAQTRAALAYERAGQVDRSRAAIEHALRLALQHKVGAARVAPSRALRARIAERQGQVRVAAADWRWLLTSAPLSVEARVADDQLARLAPKLALTKSERYERAMEFARAGRVEATEAELQRLAGAPGTSIAVAELTHARGWAHYMAREYRPAAELLTQAANQGAKYRVKDLFYAARAYSRAQEDDRAIGLYVDLAKRYPSSTFAEQARYRAARLQYILGRWEQAVQSFTAYLTRYRQGKYRAEAVYGRVIAWLASGEHGKAAPQLEQLVAAESETIEREALRELWALALLQTDQKDAAIEKLHQVIERAPLSLPALLAAARLREIDEPIPPYFPARPPAVPQPPLEAKLPAKVELLHEMGLDSDAEEELSHHEDALRRAHGDRGYEALCAAYSRLSRAARAYRAARRATSWREIGAAPSAANHWLWRCAFPQPYAAVVSAVESERKLPPHLVYAVMRQESAYRPAVVSPAGAVGLMQLMPGTAQAAARETGAEYRSDLLTSPPFNIRMGGYYLSRVLERFSGRVSLAAAAYNAGPGAVSGWLETGEKLPLDVFVARIPYQETRHYVHLVLGNLARYAFLAGGRSAVPHLDLELPIGLRAAPDDY